MKLTAVIILAACLQVTAAGYGQKISLTERDTPIEKVLKKIQQQTDYRFLYTSQLLAGTPNVSIAVKNASIEEVLDLCFRGQKLDYEINENTIIIRPRREVVGTSQIKIAEPIDIRGRVVDENGKPIPGVTVTVKGTKKQTITNENGEFSIPGVEENAVLSFSSVNMEPFTVNVSGQREIIAKLKTKTSQLDEVQIIAYGQTTKRLQTGNVSTVKTRDIQKQPVNNPLLALEGLVSGIVITQSTGIPGGGIKVRVQGQNSLSRGNDPLYVIDGVPFVSQLLPDLGGIGGVFGNNGNTSPTPAGAGNPLMFINPADIESIEILKDADATSIYGSRAAAGAVLITTKKGKAGKTNVDFNLQNGWGKVGHFIDLLNTQEYLEMRMEGISNDNATIGTGDYDLNGTWDKSSYTNWQKALIGGTAGYLDGQTSISGGTNNTQFLIGAGYHRETTVFPADLTDQRGSLHFNFTHFSDDRRFQVQLSSNYSVDNNRLINRDITQDAIRLAPNAPALYNSDGSLNWAQSAGNSTWYNPLGYLNGNYRRKTNNLLSSALVSYQILPGLDIKSSFGYNNMQIDEFSLYPLTYFAPELRSIVSRYSLFGNGAVSSWIAEPQIMYKRTMGKGSLEALIGTTFHRINSDFQQYFASGFNSDQQMEDIKSAPSISVNQSISLVYKYNALFGRINYNWQNKYILNVTTRRDGSSRFGSKNLFHNFGSVGAAWLFSNEAFIRKNISFISFGKLRGSYGTTGNDQIGDYKFMNLYNPVTFPVNFQGAIGLAPIGLPNPYLQWEETKKMQFGIDLGFFTDRILINTNYYHNRSSNQLQPYALPLLTGNNSIQTNFPATVENTGWEFSINTTNIKQRDFSWDISLNLTIPKTRIVAYPGLESSSYSNFYFIGEAIPSSRSYHFLGVDPATGLFIVGDKSGNVIANPSYPKDAVVPNIEDPRLYGGIQNNVHFKGFDLSILFQFVRQKATNYKLGLLPGFFYSDNSGTIVSNQPVTVMDRWKKPGDASFFEKFSASYSNMFDAYFNARQSDITFSDASYIRLKNVSLSWQIPKEWKKSLRLKNGKIFAQGQNLLTITKFIGLDPESKSVINLPPLRVLTIGAQITL